MIVVMVLVASLIFYISITGYAKLIVTRLSSNVALRIALWLFLIVWILVFVLGQMRLIQIYFSDYNKAISVVSLVLGAGVSAFFHRELWKQFQKLTSANKKS